MYIKYSNYKNLKNKNYEFLEMVLQVRRWGNEYECIVVLHYLVDVGREEYLIHIESC
jgi:hypothetical protein